MVTFLLAETSTAPARLKLAAGAEEIKEALDTRTPEPPAPPCTLPILLPLLYEELDRMDGPETMELLTGEATKLLRLEKEVMADGR